MESFSTTVADAVSAMTADELDRSIRALTARQRTLLLDGDLDTAWAVTEDLERCLAARVGIPRL
ncbi:hypothetical protein ASG56_12205 [Rhodococcus sp. Leaf7]|jgi:hypothetical protein|uniref:hypothetical protein n=1 Tax=unclassified Rhodococcus (in: high G+C Gram-positive bacteria) TaxID=192944 RepID=UPI0006F78582|nr:MULTISPECIES: hypothetical protein [unclassified Rhodococcus (in: high G+C Gram-positive bacteria)]KQU04155.1 hypothetical protein ASG56_12205 [Rhodococcus sp. Leaf7]KQU40340.1 hypothetical protein ASG64_12200 [Rhodococcus sp. Leaf247]